MATLWQYINKSSAELSNVLVYEGGMNIQLYYCGLIKFCNDSGVQTVEELIYNVDIDEINDFPFWSKALDLTRHSKILTNAYEYIYPEFKENIKCTPIDWERIVVHWLDYLNNDLTGERQALFALFALPAAKTLDETHPTRVAWEERLKEIWLNCKPTEMHMVRAPNQSKLNTSPRMVLTRAPVSYTPDSSKYDMSK